jgi:MarR family 2-MHQ and catechol resistance regulon transcriptional repressor
MPTHFDGDARTTLALDTIIKFTRASSALERRLVRHNALGELTLSQFGVLDILYHLGPQCQGAISAKLLKSTGNVTLVLDNLEKAGLIVRTRDAQDRRKVNLSLTPRGEAVIARVFPLQAEIIAQELGVLDPDEQRQLGQLCRKLGKGLEEPPSSDPE